MDKAKEILLNKLEDLHIALYYCSPASSEEGMIGRLKDKIKYEALIEFARENPYWDNKETSIELSNRIKKRTSL